jgi:hypothetical protein
VIEISKIYIEANKTRLTARIMQERFRKELNSK